MASQGTVTHKVREQDCINSIRFVLLDGLLSLLKQFINLIISWIEELFDVLLSKAKAIEALLNLFNVSEGLQDVSIVLIGDAS